MGKKLFVGNLSFDTTSEELQTLFSEVGTCESANVVTDRDTGRSRGFGFLRVGSGGAGGGAPGAGRAGGRAADRSTGARPSLVRAGAGAAAVAPATAAGSRTAAAT